LSYPALGNVTILNTSIKIVIFFVLYIALAQLWFACKFAAGLPIFLIAGFTSNIFIYTHTVNATDAVANMHQWGNLFLVNAINSLHVLYKTIIVEVG
jgi:hypothetical protein